MSTFKIFTRRKGIHLTNNLILWPIILIGISPLFIRGWFFDNDNFTRFENILIAGSGLAFVIGLVLKLVGFFIYQPLKGSLDTILCLENDRIIIDNVTYNLINIKKIIIRNNDYKGYFKYTQRTDFNGSLSNGVDNTFTVILNDGDSMRVNFQQNKKLELKSAQEQLISYHIQNKLHFLNLIEVLGITDYNEIQEFKKLLLKTNNIENDNPTK